jgi:predicted RND superfamily exporter protein
MKKSLLPFYDKQVLSRPFLTLMLVVLVTSFFAWYIQNFKLDISADSLVLENDKDLLYYRSINARYGSDDYLIVTYTPKADLFSEQSIDDIQKLSDSLSAIERVDSVISILNVPLISSPPMDLQEIQENIRTLRDPETDQALARQELSTSSLYKNRLVGEEADTTALQVNFKRDPVYIELRDKRDALREKQLISPLMPSEVAELEALSAEFKRHTEALMAQEAKDIAEIRTILDEHRDKAEVHLGGVPMIVADMMDFVRHDLQVFSLAVIAILVTILAVIFGQLRWVLLPLLTATIASVISIGFLGLVEWRITVVSSNFIALLLIFALSLTIHLIVRYRELRLLDPEATQHDLLLETVKSKVMPCFYTVVTTMVAFGSLVVSEIRPVIDFGWIMVMGLAVAFILTFTLFPAILMLMKPSEVKMKGDVTSYITGHIATFNERFGTTVLVLAFVATVASIVGISKLTVENRFIDYFKESTEIFQGMYLIDQKLGGTTPLDIIIDAPAKKAVEEEEFVLFDDDDGFGLDLELDGEEGFTATSHWFNSNEFKTIEAVHDYLDSIDETGKVLSLSTSMDALIALNDGEEMDDFFLSLLYKRAPEDIKASMIDPFISEDGNQIRFSVRVFESDVALQRDALLKKIHKGLTEELGFAEEQVHLTGMLVLFNNMLQSLYKSQIMTLGVVFFVIFLMFIALFRSVKLAVIAITPNLIAGGAVLGLMGGLGIPLDIMTITIASISVGIAVDNAIHYLARFEDEISKDWNYDAAMKRSHATIGQAMYYTTITVIIGFSVLALSNFTPTVYFGLLTAFAMLAALLANLTVLPLMLAKLRPYGLGPKA